MISFCQAYEIMLPHLHLFGSWCVHVHLLVPVPLLLSSNALKAAATMNSSMFSGASSSVVSKVSSGKFTNNSVSSTCSPLTRSSGVSCSVFLEPIPRGSQWILALAINRVYFSSATTSLQMTFSKLYTMYFIKNLS